MHVDCSVCKCQHTSITPRNEIFLVSYIFHSSGSCMVVDFLTTVN